jgi:hypothetical protein
MHKSEEENILELVLEGLLVACLVPGGGLKVETGIKSLLRSGDHLKQALFLFFEI